MEIFVVLCYNITNPKILEEITMGKKESDYSDTLTLNETIDRYFKEEKGRDEGTQIYGFNI